MVLQVGRFARRFFEVARKTALPLVAVTSLGAPALAQIAPPEPHRTVDANGVNLLSGTMEVKSPTITVGPAGKGGLSYSATFDTSVQQWRHSVAGGVYTESTQVQPTYPYAIAAINGESMSFAPTAGGYAPVDNPSASIVFAGALATVTLGDGSVAEFLGPYNGGGLRSNHGSISKLTRPNGEVLSYAYDASNRLLSVTNNLGYQLHFDYTASGYVVTALNNAVDSCAPTATTCTFSRTWPSLTFAANGTQQTVTDALGRVTTLTFASTFYGTINSMQSPGGKTVTLGYGTSGANLGKVTSIAVSSGATWTYNYTTQADPSSATTNHNTAAVTDPQTHTRTIGIITFPDQYEHGTQRLEYDQNALNKKTSYGWGASYYLLTNITSPEGDYVVYDYDARGNIWTVTKHPKPSLGGATYAMGAVYPTSCSNPKTCNKPTSVTDFRGATTNFTYNATHGGVETVTQPAPKSGSAQPQVRTSYSALYAYYYKNGGGSITAGDTPVYLPTSTSQCRTGAGTSCAGASNELVEEQVYSRSTSALSTNLQPDTLRKKAGDGSKLEATSLVYTAVGDVQDVTDPLGRQSHNEYDAMRQKLGAVTPDPDSTGSLLPRAQYITYDADGQVTSVKTGTVSAWNSSPGGLTALKDEQTHYDAIGRKDQSRLVVSGTIQTLIEYGYDSANRLQCTALRMDKTTFSTTPVSGCSERTNSTYAIGNRDRITSTGYDAADRVTSLTSGYLVDAIADRTTTYTDNGKVQSETDGEGNKTAYLYDAFDRLQQVTYPSTGKGSGTQNSADYETYGYDENDNRTSWRRRDGNSIGTAYDYLNRPTTKTVAASADMTAGTTYTYDYDNFGDMTSAAEGVRTIESVYDVHKRLTTETLKSSGTAIWAVNYDYDAANRRTQLTWPDNFYVAYHYDDTDALTSIRRADSAASADNIATLGYDNLGRRTSLSRGNSVSTAYSYDPSLLLLSSTAHSVPNTADNVTYGLTYNVAGQVTRRTISNSAYTWNGAYAVDRAYGTNGLNQLTTAGAATLVYDTRGDLKSDGSTTWKYDLENRLRGTTAGASLVYDPLGRLYETTTAGGTVTRYLYDGPNLIGEYNGSNVLQRRYVTGLGTDEPLVRYTGAGTTAEWMLADHQGSIVAITSSAGAVTTKNTYDEYGVPGSGNAGLFQYTGQVYLSDLSLYHYKARAYSPTLGRFLQTDPVGYADGLNWYAYVGNDPLNRSDPTGLAAATCDCVTVKVKVDGNVVWQGSISRSSVAGAIKQFAAANPGFTVAAAGVVGATSAAQQVGSRAEARSAAAAQAKQEERVPIFRAVSPAELETINKTGTYGVSPHQAGKYFALTAPGVAQFASDPNNKGYTVTSTTIPRSVLDSGFRFNDPGATGAGPSVHFNDAQLLGEVYPAMSPVVRLPGGP